MMHLFCAKMHVICVEINLIFGIDNLFDNTLSNVLFICYAVVIMTLIFKT